MSPRQPAPHGRSKTAGYAVIWLSLGALEERLSMARKDAQPIPEIWGDAWNPSVYRAKSGSTPAILGPTGLAQPCSCVKDRKRVRHG